MLAILCFVPYVALEWTVKKMLNNFPIYNAMKDLKELKRMTINPGSPAYFPKKRKRRANKAKRRK